MKILPNESLAPYTSLRVGGKAEELVVVETYDEMVEALAGYEGNPWIFGFGCNVLVSDRGLPGRTIVWRGGKITISGNEIIADAGVWWDDVVLTAINNRLWGLEMMSGIPSSVGGAVYGNIAAYGQQASDTLSWLEVYDTRTHTIERHDKSDFDFTYRWSSLQNEPALVVLRSGFVASETPTHELKYDTALLIAHELRLDEQSLEQRRTIIVEARNRAGSLYHPNSLSDEHTAGSFFKNPLVSDEQARDLARFDETGKTLERIENQSRVHGGDTHRASAAHVLLAAGFQRGQSWGNVRLQPKHVLKIETLPGATATDVYSVVMEIITTVKIRLDIVLEPEVKLLGF